MGAEQMRLLVFVLIHGGNIRVGTQNYPFIKKDYLLKIIPK